MERLILSGDTAIHLQPPPRPPQPLAGQQNVHLPHTIRLTQGTRIETDTIYLVTATRKRLPDYQPLVSSKSRERKATARGLTL